MDATELFERAARDEAEGRLDEAVEGYVSAVRADSQCIEPYERLLRLHLHRRELDAAWCAASMITIVGHLEGLMLDFYEDYAPKRLPARSGRLDAASWTALRDPDEDLGLSRIFGALAEKLAPSVADVRGFDPSVFEWAADALGASAPAPAAAPRFAPRASLDRFGASSRCASVSSLRAAKRRRTAHPIMPSDAARSAG